MGAGTYNDFNPAGLDKAVIVELTPTAALTITGIKRTERIKRLLIIGNKGGSGKTITLAHNSSSSLLPNRFGLPSDTNIVMDTGQYTWLYYDIGSEIWRAFITPHQSGGLEASPIKRVTLALTLADLQTIDTTPKIVVAAPGAGFILIPHAWNVKTVVNTASDGPAPIYRLRHTGVATDLLNQLNSAAASTGTKFMSGNSNGPALALIANFENLALEVSFNLDIGGVFDGSANLELLYSTRTV